MADVCRLRLRETVRILGPDPVWHPRTAGKLTDCATNSKKSFDSSRLIVRLIVQSDGGSLVALVNRAMDSEFDAVLHARVHAKGQAMPMQS
jgi:hypothetical protein